VKGNGKIYICIFDGKGLPRGGRSIIHNKRRTGTTAYDNGTSAYDNGTDAFTMGTDAFTMGTDALTMGTSKKGAARLKLDHVGGLRM
jgi:hypothetical protein